MSRHCSLLTNTDPATERLTRPATLDSHTYTLSDRVAAGSMILTLLCLLLGYFPHEDSFKVIDKDRESVSRDEACSF